MTQITSQDDMTSDHAHYSAPPMALASPPPVFYPDNAHAFHPQAFQAESFPQLGYPSAYPPGHTQVTQHYPAHHIYSPEDYGIAYPPSGTYGDPNIPNPHNVGPVSTPAPQAQSAFPGALRPSAKSTAQRADAHNSLDSFYAGIETDNSVSPGRAH